jgi:hypothetical protein
MLGEGLNAIKHGAMVTKTGVIDAANSSGVHWTVAFFTYLSSISSTDVARYVAIGVGLSVIAKNVIDSLVNWRRHKSEQIEDKKNPD